MSRLLVLLSFVVGCGGGANEMGVGAECESNTDCQPEDQDTSDPDEIVQECLTEFAGGYCGVADCTSDDDCPDGSACVIHTETENYCFLLCEEKVDCNDNRTDDNEANCSGNITFVDTTLDAKACVPPSSG